MTPPLPPQGPAGTPAAGARVLCDARERATAPGAPAGVAWKLAEPGRQLDANVVRLGPGARVDTHAEPDLDVLLLVVSGTGELRTAEGEEPQELAEGALVWLPHGSTRGLSAGEAGLGYLTVHRRRPGMRIGRRPEGMPDGQGPLSPA